jgi:hypothetical protein
MVDLLCRNGISKAVTPGNPEGVKVEDAQKNRKQTVAASGEELR